MSKLGVCCMIKNEDQYLEEWITYHYLIGVRDFYICDNNSEVRVEDALNAIDLPEDINVSVEYWSRTDASKQIDYYNKIINGGYKKYNTEWIAFIDIDEFIVPNTHYYLTDFVDNIDKDVFVMTWRFFVGFGYDEKPNDLVINSYKLRQDKDKEMGKTMGRPEKMRKFINPHETAGGPSRNNGLDYKKIQLNHYHVKSKEEFMEKSKKGAADGTNKNFDKYFKYKRENFVEDRNIDKYIDDLKNIMGDVGVSVSDDKRRKRVS